jgi:hypothetical protein
MSFAAEPRTKPSPATATVLSDNNKSSNISIIRISMKAELHEFDMLDKPGFILGSIEPVNSRSPLPIENLNISGYEICKLDQTGLR